MHATYDLALVHVRAATRPSALFSGVIERTGVPQVAVFLAMGALIGPFGFGLMDAGVNSPILRVVATLSLALVLFTDAVSLNLKELREHKLLAGLVSAPARSCLPCWSRRSRGLSWGCIRHWLQSLVRRSLRRIPCCCGPSCGSRTWSGVSGRRCGSRAV